MLRLGNALTLNEKERSDFFDNTGRFIGPGHTISVADYNAALDVAADEAQALDPEGLGPLDAVLIRGAKVVGEFDAMTDEKEVAERARIKMEQWEAAKKGTAAT